MTTQHTQVRLFPILEDEAPWGPEVDGGIRDLLLEFVLRGVNTLYSCQGDSNRHAYIMFEDREQWAEVLRHLADITAQFDEDEQQAWAQVSDLPYAFFEPISGEDEELVESIQVSERPAWYAIEYPEPSPRRVPVPGRPDVAHRVIIRFPNSEIGTLTRMLRRFAGGRTAEEQYVEALSAQF